MKTVNLALKKLRRLVTDAHAQLVQLETEYGAEKSRLNAVQAALFRQLREHFHKRDRLQLAVDFRQKFLDSFVRDDTDEVEQAEKEFEEAKLQLEKDYEKLAAADKTKRLNEEITEEPGDWPSRKILVKPGIDDQDDLAQLKQRHETLKEQIASANEALKLLRKSPDYKLSQLANKKPGFLKKFMAERAKELEIENSGLEKQAENLAMKIKKISGVP
jgi:hypothetical protein